MRSILARTQLSLQDASTQADPPPNSWQWLAARDPDAPPGRVRLSLTSLEQVQAVVDAVHGRAIQVGSDFIAIEVQNDLLDTRHLAAGNGRGGTGPART